MNGIVFAVLAVHQVFTPWIVLAMLSGARLKPPGSFVSVIESVPTFLSALNATPDATWKPAAAPPVVWRTAHAGVWPVSQSVPTCVPTSAMPFIENAPVASVTPEAATAFVESRSSTVSPDAGWANSSVLPMPVPLTTYLSISMVPVNVVIFGSKNQSFGGVLVNVYCPLVPPGRLKRFAPWYSSMPTPYAYVPAVQVPA